MPPATHDAPRPGSGSNNVTDQPLSAARHAIALPTTPAPTTPRLRIIHLTPRAGITRIRSERSGRTPPLSPACGTPVFVPPR